MITKLIRWLMIPLGLVIVVLGFLTFWLPIPIGLPLLLAGVALLVRFSSDARRILVYLMRRYPPLRRLMQRIRGRRRARRRRRTGRMQASAESTSGSPE